MSLHADMQQHYECRLCTWLLKQTVAQACSYGFYSGLMAFSSQDITVVVDDDDDDDNFILDTCTSAKSCLT